MNPLTSRDPRKLGRYRLLGRLGSGGMGVVFLAEYEVNGVPQRAVVKLIRSELAEDREFTARLARELESMRKVSGLYAAEILESTLETDLPWFAMEYIPGLTLDKKVATQGSLGQVEAAEFAYRLCTILDNIHKQGVIHRDIKPTNIILSPDGPRLIDFGIADISGSTQLTQTGVLVGSVGWMSPEQVKNSNVSEATDIHAWGLTVLFAVTGTPPFGSQNSAAALYKVLEEVPEVPTSLPQELGDLVRQSVLKDPLNRPSTQQILQTLNPPNPIKVRNQNLIPERVSDVRVASGEAIAPPLKNGSRKLALLSLTFSLLLVIIGVVVAFSISRDVSSTGDAGTATRYTSPAGLQPATPTTPTPSTKPRQPSPTTQVTGKLGTRGPAGGIIFYDAGSQKSWGRYLEAAPAGWSGKSRDPLDQRAGTCDDTITAGRLTSSTSIGAGERLTRALVRHCENTIYNTVAALSIGGKSDWFVPSKGELNQLYKRRDLLTGLGRTGNSSSGGATYETSTYTKLVVNDFGYSGGVWCQDFGDGRQVQFCEMELSYRPIRSF